MSHFVTVGGLLKQHRPVPIGAIPYRSGTRSKPRPWLRRSAQNPAQVGSGHALRVGGDRFGRTLYILDEPTTGLHFADIDLLLKVLQRLADAGNSVVVIEHNLDVIKTADWLVDLGPEGGAGGGMIIAEGTPEAVAANPASHTGRYLQPVLSRR